MRKPINCHRDLSSALRKLVVDRDEMSISKTPPCSPSEKHPPITWLNTPPLFPISRCSTDPSESMNVLSDGPYSERSGSLSVSVVWCPSARSGSAHIDISYRRHRLLYLRTLVLLYIPTASTILKESPCLLPTPHHGRRPSVLVLKRVLWSAHRLSNNKSLRVL